MFQSKYRKEVLRTAPAGSLSTREQIAMGAMGLAGEAGEVADLLKKFLFHGKDWDQEALVKELGDLRWYFEYVLMLAGLTMAEIERANIAKLRKRYPDGFNTFDANDRRDTK